MIGLPPNAADSVLAFAALVGTLAAITVIRARSAPDGLAARFIFVLALVAAILATRLLAWHLNALVFDTIGRIVAAWIPLAALVVVEGLQRRHAPAWMKYGALVGGGLCTVLAFVDAGLQWPILVLLAVQLIAFVGVYGLALTADRHSLTTSEAAMLTRLRVAMPILLVCLASDYGVFAPLVTLRGSSVAILFFCWLAIGSSAATVSRWDAAWVLLAATLAALGSGLAAGLATASLDLGIAVGAMTLSVAILVLVLNEAIRAFAASRRDDVLAALAAADTTSVRSFVASLASGTQLQGATIVEGETLADFDTQGLRAAFARTPVMDRADLERIDGDLRQQLDSLFVTYDASHLLLLSSHPLRLGTVTLNTIGSAAALKTELALVQRMAVLVAGQGA